MSLLFDAWIQPDDTNDVDGARLVPQDDVAGRLIEANGGQSISVEVHTAGTQAQIDAAAALDPFQRAISEILRLPTVGDMGPVNAILEHYGLVVSSDGDS